MRGYYIGNEAGAVRALYLVVPRAEKAKMENFGKTAYIIGKLRKKCVGNAYQTIFLTTF